MMNVRLTLSAGAIILAILHAAAMVGGFYAIHVPIEAARQSQTQRLDPLPLPTASDYDYGRLRQPTVAAPPVNRNALDEIKQQAPSTKDEMKAGKWVYNPNTGEHIWCNDCGVPALHPSTRVVTPSVPARVPTPAPILPSTTPSTITIPAYTTGNSLPAPKEYELALFLDGSARSSTLLQWFSTDPTLLKVRAISNYQVFTADSPLYRARYANIVRPEHFPAVLFQYPDGGHIHAAGGNFLPATAQQLFADMKQGVTNARQIRDADRQMTGMIRQAGYNWDRTITPAMTLGQSGSIGQEGQDCIDGNCRPGSGGALDRLFDRARDQAQAVAWVGAGEMVVIALCFLAVLLVVMIAMKRGV